MQFHSHQRLWMHKFSAWSHLKQREQYCYGNNNAGYFRVQFKVIYPKYSKHWPYTVAYTIDCVCSKMLNHGLFLSLFKLIPCPIHWIVYVLATNKKEQMPPQPLITLTCRIKKEKKKKNLKIYFFFYIHILFRTFFNLNFSPRKHEKTELKSCSSY